MRSGYAPRENASGAQHGKPRVRHLAHLQAVVVVHDDVHEQVDDDRQPLDAELLGHGHVHEQQGGGVVVHVQERRGLVARSQEERVEKLVELGAPARRARRTLDVRYTG